MEGCVVDCYDFAVTGEFALDSDVIVTCEVE